MHAGPQVPMNVFEPPSPPMSSSMPSESDFERLCRSSPVPIEILTMRTPEDHSFNLPSSTSYTLDPEPEPEYEEDTFSIIDPEAGFSPEEAFAAAQDGIHYATEKYPSENSSLSPAFRKEPVSLEKGDRVFVLDEVQLSPYLSGMRVKVERTAEVGLVPIWVVEGALERLARVNMAFNEAATCPAEMAADNKGQENTPGPALAHRHSRCINTPKTKIRNGDVHTFNQQDNSEEGSEDDLPLTPKQTNNERELFPELRRAKSVMFESVQQRKIFRYPPPPELFVPVKRAAWDNSDASDGSDEEQERKMKQDKKQKTGSDNDNTVVEGRDDEGKEQWWWSGWEEVPEEPFSEPEARGGRPQVRRRSHWFTEDSSDED